MFSDKTEGDLQETFHVVGLSVLYEEVNQHHRYEQYDRLDNAR